MDDGHTTAMIETIKTTLDAIGVQYHVEIEGEETTGVARNLVLEPLREMYRSAGRVFNTVVMMGDDLWCAEELWELLYLSRGQGANIVCSTDVRSEVLLLKDYPHSRETNFQFLRATTSAVDCSVRVTSQTTLQMTSPLVASEIIIPSAYNHVSPPSQSSIQLLSTLLMISPFPCPTTLIPTNVPPSSSPIVAFPEN